MADVTDKPVVKDDASSNKKIGPDGAKKALDGKNGKMKWYLVGGLGVVAVLVFFFVSRSKTNAAGGSTASGTSGGTLDPSTEAALESALQSQASGGFASTATGSTGATGATGAAGATGPAGPVGATGPASTKTSALPVATSSKYTVKAGDTLASLSSKFGISIGTLAHANTYVKGEASASKVGQTLGTGAGLKTGQVLTVPHKV